MSLQDCRNTSYNPRMISDNMMCAGYPDGQKDSCQVSFSSVFNLKKLCLIRVRPLEEECSTSDFSYEKEENLELN